MKFFKSIDTRWSHDQVKPLEKYLSERNKIELISKNDILKYKISIEEIDKKFYNCFKSYCYQENVNKQIKIKLNQLVDQLKLYESMIDALKKELENTTYISNLHKIRGSDNFGGSVKSKNKINFGFNFSDDGKLKKTIIEKEINRILIKFNAVSKEVIETNQSMIENVNKIIILKFKLVDRLKYELEVVEKEKFKKKLKLEQYLIMYEKKQEELIRSLSEDLKLSENFVKFYKF